VEEREDDVECKKWKKWVLKFLTIVDGLTDQLQYFQDVSLVLMNLSFIFYKMIEDRHDNIVLVTCG
jgi:hypothetical protein